MSTLSVARDARRLAQEHPAWVLLRSRHAAVAVPLLARRLGGETVRLPEAELVVVLEDDLAGLRDHGFDAPPAAELVHDWLTDGILVRRLTGREETVELSAGAQEALAFAGRLERPQPLPTTRLATLTDRLRALAGSGTADRLEHVRELLALAADLPAAVARLRADLERTDAGLRARLGATLATDAPGAPGAPGGTSPEALRRDDFLDDVYRGVDHLAASPAGRAVTELTRLLREHGHVLDDAPLTAQGLDLAPAEAEALRRLGPAVRDAADDAAAALASLRRGLVRFVRAGEVPGDRTLHALMRAAEAAALAAAEDIPLDAPVHLALETGAVDPATPAALVPHRPEDDAPAPRVFSHAGRSAGLDAAALRALARESEIDVAELRAHVNAVVARRGQSSVADVLERHPASQGLAGVLGLLVLADQHGRRAAGSENVAWQSESGHARRATVPRHLFEEPVP
ncbi:DUF3375 domain-containing protein [Antribacter sp. KLBMP9083]|uniref:DUF3375 domain-containing protein n=1 Tax=Antribacter soli TaxID=2910976 RepID=A0AA41UD86_9MICO|nr:DUF3375 family protein [Antribacter soli]MCF4122849.1 DUF3375 domain-containing protein [Antribacter soli]